MHDLQSIEHNGTSKNLKLPRFNQKSHRYIRNNGITPIEIKISRLKYRKCKSI